MVGVDVKRFWIYIYDTRVSKGWDWVKLPDGRVVKVREGKYVKIYREKPLEFGFEDLTEEIGQKPDWDYDEPRVKIIEEKGFIVKTVRIECRQGGAYDVALYYNNIKVYDSKIHGKGPVTIEFKYVESKKLIPTTLLAILSAVGIGLAIKRLILR